jgi:hypothetical protein
MTNFVSASAMMAIASPKLRQEVDAEVRAFILTEDAARVKGHAIRCFGEHANAFGAKVFAEMPDGTKVSLPFNGLHHAT